MIWPSCTSGLVVPGRLGVLHLLPSQTLSTSRVQVRHKALAGVSGMGLVVLLELAVPGGFGMLHRLFLSLDSDLADAAAQRELCRVRELPSGVTLQQPEHNIWFNVLA